MSILDMSDEDFAKLTSAPAQEEEQQATQPVVDTPDEEEQEQEELGQDPEEEEAEEESVNDDPEDTHEGEPTPSTAPDSDPSLGSKEPESSDKEKNPKDSTNVESKGETDYKTFYEKVMAPFKANGKMIELHSEEEAIQLMKMGANYTRKMQDIAPHRKVLMMLENNGLLDESKLSYLIDLDKKNPEAIKRLVKDSGIDPMEIDPDAEPAYQVGNHHAVSDAEANFRSALDDVLSTPTGQETVTVINGWDQASKKLLWDQPGAMALINTQRETGIYDRISTEIERQKALGLMPVSKPFLEAYTEVGNSLMAAGAFNDIAQPNVQQHAPAPIASKVAVPKSKVNNSDRASAAATSKSTANKAKPLVNPLAMSDEEFLKTMTNRV